MKAPEILLRFRSIENFRQPPVIVLTFSEPMSNGTGGAFGLTVGGSTFFGGAITWNPDATVMTYTPGTAYGYGKTVVWTLSTGFDVSGKAMTTGKTGSFTTELQIGIGR